MSPASDLLCMLPDVPETTSLVAPFCGFLALFMVLLGVITYAFHRLIERRIELEDLRDQKRQFPADPASQAPTAAAEEESTPVAEQAAPATVTVEPADTAPPALTGKAKKRQASKKTQAAN